MNYLDKETSIEIFEEIMFLTEEVIEMHEIFNSSYTKNSTAICYRVKEQLKELKDEISMKLRLLTQGEMKGFPKDVVLPALCTANYLLAKIGMNRINHNSYLSVNRELVIVHYYIKKHYKFLLES
ncbi:hypothetical protein [Sutcliffiella rhizosphaerae]|uniref:Uncharacterized protein n=1 Tax=Sutcliffiella rhizosphaerae TaxID=2880967 RepID=A0ABM8YKM0_9BACI|nr:hypothetical protein [Sutcliffiella rhizosphaerae]CAG9620492.1 hypothetical protein BACCIP111883_01261 [Sutcliffiella rhizosphaerae]